MTVQEGNEPVGSLIEHVPLPDLERCNVLIITCGAFEFERLDSPYLEYWPHAIRTKLEREQREWFAQHPDRKPVFVSTGIGARTCFLVVHHAQK